MPSDVLPDIEAAMEEYGEPMVLRRRQGITANWATIEVRGVLRQYSPGEILGSIQQGDQRALLRDREIKAAGWPTPPARNDQIVAADGRPLTVMGATTKRLAGTVLVHDLWVRG